MRALIPLFCFLFLSLFANQIVQAQLVLKPLGLDGLKIKPPKEVQSKEAAVDWGNQLIAELIGDSYLAASFDSISILNDTAILFFHGLEKYKWAQLDKGNVPEEELLNIDPSNRLFLSRPFSGKQLQNLFNKIIKYYENIGYPFASVKLDQVTIGQDQDIHAELQLKKNQKYSFDSLILSKNPGINKSYLMRHLGLEEGSIYQEQNIALVETRLKELPFIQILKKPELQFFEEHVKLLLSIKRKQASRFNGILGLLTDEETGKIELTGDIDFNLLNGFKRGEQIGLKWRKLKGNSQELNLNFGLPYFLNSAFGIESSFLLFKRDTSFLDLNAQIGVNYNLRRAEFLKIFYKNKQSNLLSRKSLINNNSGSLPALGDVRINSIGLAYRLERLDYRFNPRKGWDIQSEFAIGQKRLLKILALEQEFPDIYENINLKTNQFEGSLSVSKFFPIKNRSSFLVRLSGSSLYSEQVYSNELFRIGGLNSLRGFDEASILASTFTILSLEYRFLLDQNSFFNLFGDFGNYEVNTSDEYYNDQPIGLGAGINFETNAGIFSLNYAIGKQFNNPIDLRAAKIHFGFINYF